VTKIFSTFSRHAILWLSLTALVVVVFFVNPLREAPCEDDWAYALTVRHLIDTGKYEPHQWITPNVLFQAYWGAFFSTLFGHSLATLMISTLALLFMGLVAFYLLGIEYGLDSTTTGLATLALLSSPLFLRLSFSFMTDIPLVVLMIIALLFYTVALRSCSVPWMCLASVAVSCALLIRPTAAALVASVFLLWACNKEFRARKILFVAGIALPIAVTAYVILFSMQTPTWGAAYAKGLQFRYFHDISRMLVNVLWRPGAILQYLAFFLAPFVLLALLTFTREINGPKLWGNDAAGREPHQRWRQEFIILAAITVFILFSALIGFLRKDTDLLMPYLPWHFHWLKPLGVTVQLGLTIFTIIGAILFGRILVLRYLFDQDFGQKLTRLQLLDFLILLLISYNLFLFRLTDRYLVHLLPFILLLLGRHLGKYLAPFRSVILVACLVTLTGSTLWTRQCLERSEAEWRSCMFLVDKGIEPEKISGPWWWDAQTSFDEYLSNVASAGSASLGHFTLWMQDRSQHCPFLVVDDSVDMSGNPKWEIINEIKYKDVLLRNKRILVFKRLP
jgi:hypothetical protein